METKFAWAVRQMATSVLFAILAPPLPLAAESRPPAGGKQWHVQYAAGTILVARGKGNELRALPPGRELKVTVDKQQVVCRAGKTVVLSVPVADVTEVSYEVSVHRRSKQVLGGLMSGGGCRQGDSICVAFVFGTLVAAAVSAPFKYTQHFVQVA
jgi:hypothetical protein